MNSRQPQPIVVLISGRGSNLRALIEESRREPSSFRVARVLSNQASAAGLALAGDLGIDTHVIPSKNLDRSTFDRSLMAVIDESRPSLIVLAGFMRILSPDFVDHYVGRILNIHPSLLPAYTGLLTHQRVLQAQETTHGATVHFVTAELDGGPPVLQGRIRIQAGDDAASLAARVQVVEHRIFPTAVRWFCEGRLHCDAGHAWLDGTALDAPVLYDY